MNEASPSSSNCPQCGVAIPQDAPQGLCPKCLLKQASFPTETGHTTRHSRPAPPDREELARAFPHLQILELIGQGGMGFVYKARQPKLDRIVALKILAQPLAEQTQFAERFTREGRTLARLSHPNIVTIHDFGQAGPFFYLLMEYVDGVNLRQAMRAGAINSSQALAIVPRICEALQYAHNEGVLHRDIKPDNILLDTRGRVKIADFGIAKLMAEAVAENPLTGSGASLGTPHYMAPEQIEKPNAVDHRADIYSLGVVFYEMLTGELPLGRFAAPSATSGTDPRLDEVVFQTLEKQPDRRPQSADEVRTRVETISTTPAPPDALPEPAITFKMARCYITSPEFLATWTGRLMKYYGRGDLRLDQQNLTYAPNGNWNVIPLRAITQLTLGTSRVGMCHMKVLAVTFTEKDKTHRLYFVPNRGPMRSVYDSNDLVEEWFSAVQFAIKSSTGKLPSITREDLRATPGVTAPRVGSTFIKAFAVFLIFLTIGLILLERITRRRPSPSANPSPLVTTDVPPKKLGRDIQLNLITQSSDTILVRATNALAGDEEITPVIRYGQDEWTQTPAVYSVQERTADILNTMLNWKIPSAFTRDFDIAAAVERARNSFLGRPLSITPDSILTLFSITNGLNQTVSGGIRYRVRSVAPVPDETIAFVTGQEARGIGSSGGPAILNMDFVGDLPPATIVEANFESSDSRPLAPKTFQLPSRFSVQCEGWVWPLTGTINEQIRTRIPLPLNQRVKIFTVTNYSNGPHPIGSPQKIEAVVTGFLTLKRLPLRSASTAMAAPSSATQSGDIKRKSFEFSNVTHTADYLVLRSETPMPVGQRLTALIEDSSGNVTRSISGLTLIRNRNELTTSASAMWVNAPGLATNWIPSALEQINESVLRKPLHFSEGETIRLFKLKSEPGASEKFAAVRFDTIRVADPNAKAQIQARSVYPLRHGFTFFMEAHVPEGYRLEALCDPTENGTEARLDVSHIQGKDNYHAMWSFDALQPDTLDEQFGATLTNQFNQLTKAPIQLSPGESKTLFTFKAPSREFRAVLKLATPE